MDDLRSTLLAEVEAFCKEFNVAESTVGTYALQNGVFFKRLRQGRRFEVRSYERVMEFIRKNREGQPKSTVVLQPPK